MKGKPSQRRSAGNQASRTTTPLSAIRALTLAGATLTTGLIAGVFYAYAVSVNLGLADQPDESYIAAMDVINERIQNPLFFASFFGAISFLLAALAVHSPKLRSGRFRLIALACALYVGGGFLLTVIVNVPLNEALAGVAVDASAGELARARAAYEDLWNFWNGVRTAPSSAPACCARTALRGPEVAWDDAGRACPAFPAPHSNSSARPESREHPRCPARGARDLAYAPG